MCRWGLPHPIPSRRSRGHNGSVVGADLLHKLLLRVKCEGKPILMRVNMSILCRKKSDWTYMVCRGGGSTSGALKEEGYMLEDDGFCGFPSPKSEGKPDQHGRHRVTFEHGESYAHIPVTNSKTTHKNLHGTAAANHMQLNLSLHVKCQTFINGFQTSRFKPACWEPISWAL